jgi:hypothetical protein
MRQVVDRVCVSMIYSSGSLSIYGRLRMDDYDARRDVQSMARGSVWMSEKEGRHKIRHIGTVHIIQDLKICAYAITQIYSIYVDVR